mmetsp:Transcript_38156/g.96551  ORF Transcript_38156/g.96551 Transcript_38156/m.96551 type:complete len:138 (-) Transcript_38156:328-741(-)|eukprot:CAMPEP_0202857056 /NCGR_PEP_ID=MMETSP1391-20130828/141_1 /ASSEMBLY_ACC=CAM_ASM_000867 /TAXON_ID=1034604 /ORGANISM="Chlamydomonas leiostraca, Strain SAG 11-49" /LENGTH=137 /DNA_ID=CAMNT_0049535813 /DNA_START=26 /DNA_END=439 /DNA_ORIENTATION=+
MINPDLLLQISAAGAGAYGAGHALAPKKMKEWFWEKGAPEDRESQRYMGIGLLSVAAANLALSLDKNVPAATKNRTLMISGAGWIPAGANTINGAVNGHQKKKVCLPQGIAMVAGGVALGGLGLCNELQRNKKSSTK